MIDEAYGLDNYLLKTPVNEVYSFLALRIKREILLRLAATATTSGDSSSSRSQAVASKYQDYVWPREVADWHGLPWLEAEGCRELVKLRQLLRAVVTVL